MPPSLSRALSTPAIGGKVTYNRGQHKIYFSFFWVLT